MPEPKTLQDSLTRELETLDRELTEIDMLINQAKVEAGRHEAKRQQIDERAAGAPIGSKEATDLSAQLLQLTRRAALMEAQVEVLEGKRKALGRFRDSVEKHAAVASDLPDIAMPGESAGEPGAEPQLPPAQSRAVLAAQEDLRREIARAMHDGPAQSLTNIVLQAQIVERLVTKDPERAKAEVPLLVSMVQQTLDATKSFIFDVRPMVLDDLGLVPTLRRATRERGRRANVTIDFESNGADRRLPVDVESGLFRILDEALAAYLSIAPDTLRLRLDWADRVEASVEARRAGAELAGVTNEPEVPEGKDLPPALAAMLDDRRADRVVRAEKARVAAIAALPEPAWREIQRRAATIGLAAELLDDGGTLRVATVAEPELAGEPAPEPVAG